MQTCSQCNKQSPDAATTCSRCGVDLSVYSTLAVARADFQKNDRVSKIRVAVSADCCPACAAAQGAYAKNKVPTLPILGCSGAQGCRCHYEPVLTEIYP